MKNSVLMAVPGRWWAEVIEVPMLLSGMFWLAQLVAGRLQDVLPAGAYLHITPKQAAAAAETSQ